MKKITFFSKYFEYMRKYLYICSKIRIVELFISKKEKYGTVKRRR